MITFSENNIWAISNAYITFIKSIIDNKEVLQKNNVNITVKSALDNGLTIDEIFNIENWNRAKYITNYLTYNNYIDILINNHIKVKSIKEEDNWTNENNIQLLHTCLHDYYYCLRNKGGKFNNNTILESIENVIMRYNYQSLMNEDYITQLNLNIGYDLNYYQYIISIVEDKSILPIIDFSKEQIARKEKSEPLKTQKKEMNTITAKDYLPSEDIIEAENFDYSQENEPQTEINKDNKDNIEIINNNVTINESVTTKPLPFEIEQEETEFIETPIHQDDVFIAIPNAKEVKYNAIKNVLFNIGVTVTDMLTLCYSIYKNNENATLDDLILKLTNNEWEWDIDKENDDIKTLHKRINKGLLASYIDYIKIQGITPPTQEELENKDILLECWDLRDKNTRKLYKLKKLFFEEKIEDDELKEIIKDLEQYYKQN